MLSRRFVEAGLDSYERITAAGEEGIRRIKGVNPHMAGPIVAQASELLEEGRREKTLRVAELRLQTAGIRDQVQALALGVKERFAEKTNGPAGKKVEQELVKIVSSLERVEERLETRGKRAGKCLTIAERRLATLSDAGLKGLGKGLKKARKALKKVYE